jgi:hypothetical protein
MNAEGKREQREKQREGRKERKEERKEGREGGREEGRKEGRKSQTPVAHVYNPSYLEDRDQEDRDSKPVRANSSQYPISKIPNAKKGWYCGSRCRL